MTVSTVGVIGAGQMGNGIAHVMALAGYDVQLNDVNPDALDTSLDRIKKIMVRQLKCGKITENKEYKSIEDESGEISLLISKTFESSTSL